MRFIVKSTSGKLYSFENEETVICSDAHSKRKEKVIHLSSLSELVALVREYGQVVILPSVYATDSDMMIIEIYDDYRE